MRYARGVKVLGLGLVSALLMAALTAASASASLFEAERYPVTVEAKGTNTQLFHVNTGTVTCTTSSFLGSATEASELLTVAPEYTGCTFPPLEGPATVAMNGCEYKFHAGAKVSPGHFAGTVDIVPEKCGPIVAKAATCEVRVPSQNGLSGIEYVDKGEKANREVEVIANVTSIKYEERLLGCLTPGTHENGVYEGKALTKGFDEFSNQEGVWVE